MTDPITFNSDQPPAGLPDDGENPVLAVPPSRLEEIKARRERLQKHLYVDLDLPSWQGDVVARYKVFSKAERIMLQKAKFEDQTIASLAMMTKACIGIYLDDGLGNLEPITEPDGTIARYGLAAAEMLDVNVPSQATDHDICRLMCGDNSAAIEAHANTLGSWMMNPTSPAMTPAST